MMSYPASTVSLTYSRSRAGFNGSFAPPLLALLSAAN